MLTFDPPHRNRFSPVESIAIAWILTSGLSVFLQRGTLMPNPLSRLLNTLKSGHDNGMHIKRLNKIRQWGSNSTGEKQRFFAASRVISEIH